MSRKTLVLQVLCAVLGGVCIFMMSVAGCSSEGTKSEPVKQQVEEPEPVKQEVMDGETVSMYLDKMTDKYGKAYTVATTPEQRHKYLTGARGDICLAKVKIESAYEEGTPPTKELQELGDNLLNAIDGDYEGDPEKVKKYATNAGRIISDVSKEYCDGELPLGVTRVIEESELRKAKDS